MKLTIDEIRKMASAWDQVQEAKKKKMDPVGKADADIDNDGDVDSSDEYLHKRRKAISKAMKGKQTETEVQESVELGESKDHVSVSYDYMGDGPGHPAKQEIQNHATKHGGSSMKITSVAHDGPGGGASEVMAKGHVKHAMKFVNHHHDENYSLDHSGHKKYKKDYGIQESVELDEISKTKMGQYIKRAHSDKETQKKRADVFDKKGMYADKDKDMYNAFSKADRARKKAGNRTKFIGKAVDKLTKEATELDELNKKTLGSYVKKASRDVANRSADNARDYATGNRPVGMNKKSLKNWKREIGIDKAVDKMAKEATELDELNKKTLGSYIKKASGSAAGIAAVTSAQAAIKGKSNPDDRRQLRNRLTGISRATDKVTKEEVDEAKRKGAPKMTGDFFAIQRAKDAELNKALGRTKTGRKKPVRQMTSTQRSLASMRNEETQLDELKVKNSDAAFKLKKDIRGLELSIARLKPRALKDDDANMKLFSAKKRLDKKKAELNKLMNEAVMSADKKPEKYVTPDGTVGIRMVRVNKEVIKKDA